MLGVAGRPANISGPPSAGGVPFVGLRYVPTNNESTAPSCLCEGGGAADAASSVSGFADNALGIVNVVPISFTSTPTTAVSVVEIGTTPRVTHDYHSSLAAPNLFEVTLTIENISAADVDLRYTRTLDWDVEPTLLCSPIREAVSG